VKGSTYVSRLEREFVSEASNEKTNFKNETKDANRANRVRADLRADPNASAAVTFRDTRG